VKIISLILLTVHGTTVLKKTHSPDGRTLYMCNTLSTDNTTLETCIVFQDTIMTATLHIHTYIVGLKYMTRVHLFGQMKLESSLTDFQMDAYKLTR
jgi:hypothetical protein